MKFQINNKKQFTIVAFFLLLGIGIILSTIIQYGFGPEGRFGIIGGSVAIVYALLRNKLLVRSKK